MMKVLYAIQTTGNGHLSRAKEFIPYLERRFQVDVVLSGPKLGLSLDRPIKHHYQGLTLFHTQKGGIHWGKTIFKNNILQFIIDLFRAPVHQYDLVINDYEPITAWGCKLHGVLCFGLSNQFSLWQKKFPDSKKKWTRKLSYIRFFAPVKYGYGLHYKAFDNNIYHPIIRSKIRHLVPTLGGGIVVYLPAHPLEEIIKVISTIEGTQFKIFSKDIIAFSASNNYSLHPINETAFISALAAADGVITNAGFTTTAESVFLNKPLMVVPMRGQVEQQYNAYTLKKMGVAVLKHFDVSQQSKIEKWIKKPKNKRVLFHNNLHQLVDQIALDYIKIKYNSQSIPS